MKMLEIENLMSLDHVTKFSKQYLTGKYVYQHDELNVAFMPNFTVFGHRLPP